MEDHLRKHDLKIPLRTQLLSCAALAGIALAILLFRRQPLAALLLGGWPWWQQALAGIALGLAAGGMSALTTLRKPHAEAVQRTAASYTRLDLSGWNPLWISLAAGVSEELLFRAALQPLAGVWGASLLFLLVHAGAYDFRRFDRAALWQASGVFGMGVLLGFAFDYIGLLAVMIAHALVDIIGLYLVRRIAEGAKRLR
ncbi:CPBP family intramembrane glutamic endopeptidase [Pseudoduganella sp. R-31]|uniref:CPBP family intramembrane glutamic endopeptidase n=1 Tax=Pseudoduganella sp. R-31 TaxID=3404060 RepID=UPI003CF5620D